MHERAKRSFASYCLQLRKELYNNKEDLEQSQGEILGEWKDKS